MFVCPTCKKAPPAGVVVCPNDGTALPTRITPRTPYQNSAKIQAARSRPEVITGPELHRQFDAMSTERLAPEHIAAIQRERALSQGEAFETQQMSLSNIASKLDFELRPGLSVGEYIVEEKLGEGGMGEIWRARQPMIDKQVALKVLGQDVIANKSSLSRFLQEARAVNQIKHRNLVDIFSFGELPDGRPYFVMELLDGQDLGRYLEEQGPLPFSLILLIFDQTCRALQAAHDRNIIHRDLKPDNIYLILDPTQPPFVKLLDFGIAKLSDAGGKGLTHTNAVFGTPGYMAPEQCEGAKNVDHRADLYALGVILFEVITGQTPFAVPGESAFATVARQMTTAPPKASEKIHGRTIPAAVETFLQRALSRKREDRPQNCTEFYQQLVSAVGELKTETREQMMLATLNEPTAVNIDTDHLSLPKQRLTPRSQLGGLVGEVVVNPPKRDKKRLGVFIAAGAASVLVGILSVAMWPSEPSTTNSIQSNPTPAQTIPSSAPTKQAASLVAPTSQEATPTKKIKNPKEDKKNPIIYPIKNKIDDNPKNPDTKPPDPKPKPNCKEIVDPFAPPCK